MKVGKLIGEATNEGEGENGEPNYDWEEVTAQMTAIMKDKTQWDARVTGFGWRNLEVARNIQVVADLRPLQA